MTGKKIKVLIVDDSAVVRKVLSSILATDPGIEVIGTAADPFIAAGKIQQALPDVITLDLEMPRMNGIVFLKRIMSQHPIPVVVISGLTAAGTEAALEALAAGAVDVLKKPSFEYDKLNDGGYRIIDTVKAASNAVLKRKTIAPAAATPVRNYESEITRKASEKIIAIGASTGGTEALFQFLHAMPSSCPGIVIVQHMPEGFTRSFAERLNRTCSIAVKEASHGATVLRGQALIAPGNKHMEVKHNGQHYYVDIRDGEPVNRHRPSVDVLFSSIAKCARHNASGIIMTGMGADGAKGLLEMRKAGSLTIAQDEETCVVFGMPREAIKLDAAKKILALQRIPSAILAWCSTVL